MHARTPRRRRTAVVGTVAGALTLLAVAAAGNAVETTTPSTAAPSTRATTGNTTAVADGAIPPALLQQRNKVFDRIARLSTTLGKKRADFDFSVGVNPNTNTLVVDVFSDKKVKLPDLGAALKLENHVGGHITETAGASGGAEIQDKSGGECTMGFAVRINNSQNAPTGFLTAAHCFDEPQPASNIFRMKADNGIMIDGVGHKYGNRPAEADWGVVVLKRGIILDDEALGQVKSSGKKTYPVTGLREAVVGTKVCKHGASTQTTCGEVEAVGVRRSLRNTIADGLIQTSVCAEHGDSGSPLFTDPTPNATTVEGIGLLTAGTTYSEKDPNGKKGVCGEKVDEPNVAWFVPLSQALTQANAQAPKNDISLVTQ